MFYSERARLTDLASWLLEYEDDDERAEVSALADAGRFGEAEQRIGELSDSSGHEWTFETVVAEVERAEQIRETEKEAILP